MSDNIKNKIMVVDSSDDDLKLLSSALEETQYQYYSFNNQEEAIANIDEIQPDIIVCYMSMDYSDELNIPDFIEDSGKDTPIIMISDEEPLNLSMAMDLGAVVAVLKTPDYFELIETLDEMIQAQ